MNILLIQESTWESTRKPHSSINGKIHNYELVGFWLCKGNMGKH